MIDSMNAPQGQTARKCILLVAPTRATCVNIHTALSFSDEQLPETLLMREKKDELLAAVDSLDRGGFGIVAGTGVGKTLAMREICRRTLRTDLKVEVVTREHDTTPATWQANVVVVTPGVAANWLKDKSASRWSLVIIDEIHQTSEHLELSMALAKRNGIPVIWASATIDPTVYKEYLRAHTVIRCNAFDPQKRARVYWRDVQPSDYFKENLLHLAQDSSGTAVFVPTRAMAEELARSFGEASGLHADFYHGGESAEKIRPYLTGEVPRPFVVFMTSAGASSLNVMGLKRVIIVDKQFVEEVRGGVKMLETQELDNNTLLQMAGRVNGRVSGAEVVIISQRELDFHALQPMQPRFVLGGDLRRVALICARLGINPRELDLIGDVNHRQLDAEFERFRERGLIVANGEFHLSPLGDRVERLPVEPHWGEMLVAAQDSGDEDLFKVVVMAACQSKLYALTKVTWKHSYEIQVTGSDHLTSYNIVATALQKFGTLRKRELGLEYGFRGDWGKGHGEFRQLGEFLEWCDDEGLVAKEIKNVALGVRAVLRQLNIQLPDPDAFPRVLRGSELERKFIDLLVRVGSFEFMSNWHHAKLGEVRPSKRSVCQGGYALGVVNHFVDQRGQERRNYEGTTIPESVLLPHVTLSQLQVDSFDLSSGYAHVSGRGMYGDTYLSYLTARVPAQSLPLQFQPLAKEAMARELANLTDAFLTGDELVADVVRDNIVQLERGAKLNRQLRQKAFFEVGDSRLVDHYRGALDGVCSLQELQDPEALRLPALDDRVYAQFLADHPDEIHVAGVGMSFPVDYSETDPPRIYVRDAKLLLKLPSSGLFLPGGMAVEVSAHLNDLCFYATSCDLPMLQGRILVEANRRQWNEFVKRSPAVALPDPTDENATIPLVTVEYGVCVLTGSRLDAFGTVERVGDGITGSPFRAVWFATRAEAESAQSKAREELAALASQRSLLIAVRERYKHLLALVNGDVALAESVRAFAPALVNACGGKREVALELLRAQNAPGVGWQAKVSAVLREASSLRQTTPGMKFFDLRKAVHVNAYLQGAELLLADDGEGNSGNASDSLATETKPSLDIGALSSKFRITSGR